MGYTIDEFLEYVEPRIFTRGEDYYENGMVKKVIKSDGHYTAKVSGSNTTPYTVKIFFDKDETIEDWSCSCPYDFSDVCKHIVALLLAIENGDYIEKKTAQPPSTAGDESLGKLLANAGKKELERLVLDHCQRDDSFRMETMVTLSASEERAFVYLKEMLQASIRRNTHRGYVDYHGCDNICRDMERALDIAHGHMERGWYSQAIDIAQLIILTCVKLASHADSSSGSLSFTVDIALKIIDSCIGALVQVTVSDPQRRKQLGSLLKTVRSSAFDGWEDWRYELLRQAARLANSKSAPQIYALLDQLLEERKETNYFAHMQQKDKCIRYYVILAAEGKEAAGIYLEQNLDVDELRYLAVQEELKGCRFADAERLCLDKTKTAPNRQVFPDRWEYLLYEIYHRWGRRDQEKAQTRRLLLLGDQAYYEPLKRMLQEEDLWEAEYPELLAAMEAVRPCHEYMALLAREGEKERLMEQVRRHPYMVFDYGKMLPPSNAGEVYDLCAAFIRENAAQASERKVYRDLCNKIRLLNEFGGKAEAQELIDELIQSYPRRPAMLDELGEIRRRLMANQK